MDITKKEIFLSLLPGFFAREEESSNVRDKRLSGGNLANEHAKRAVDYALQVAEMMANHLATKPKG